MSFLLKILTYYYLRKYIRKVLNFKIKAKHSVGDCILLTKLLSTNFEFKILFTLLFFILYDLAALTKADQTMRCCYYFFKII